MSKLNEIIVSQLPIQSEVKPCTAYLLDNGDGTHDRYVSDEDGNLSKLEGGIKSIQAGTNITIDNTDPKNPIISSTGGGTSDEMDPIFSASPSATITNSDISNWNSKLSAEKDTLESVTDRGNVTTKEIIFGKTATPVKVFYNDTLKGLYLSNTFNPNTTGLNNIVIGEYTGKNFTTASRNILIGSSAGNYLTTGDKNTLVGYNSGYGLNTGTQNSILGHLAGQGDPSGSSYNYSTIIGSYAGFKLKSGDYNTIIGTSAVAKIVNSSFNTFVGSNAGQNLSSIISETNLQNISPAALSFLSKNPDFYGYDSVAKTFNTSLNTFVGQGINSHTNSPTIAAMSTIIGASSLINCLYTNFNNIVIGAGNYMTTANSAMYNSIVIGNSVNLPNQQDTLAIGMDRSRRINAEEAIIYGKLPNTQLTFNAPITVSSAFMPNAQGDSTYTKQLVAKPNGDIGWEDKQVIKVKPVLIINSYQKIGTNYVIKGVVNNLTTNFNQNYPLDFSVSVFDAFTFQTANAVNINVDGHSFNHVSDKVEYSYSFIINIPISSNTNSVFDPTNLTYKLRFLTLKWKGNSRFINDNFYEIGTSYLF